MADRYANSYGGQSVNTADRLRLSIGSSSSIDSSQVPSAEYGFVQDYMSRHSNASVGDVRAAYDQTWAEQSDAHLLRQARESLTLDNASLRVVGRSEYGGLIWNTGAVSYPVDSPDIDVRTLANIPNSTTQPVYDLLTGLPTGYTTEAYNTAGPTMGYGEQMRNVVGFAGTFGKNFSLGVAHGGIGLLSDAAKGWAMIGDLVLNGGSNISQLEQFNLRPFEYDPGVGQFGGAVGEIVSPGAYLRAAELGVVGLRALGPTADAAIYSYMQRTGGVLSATEINEVTKPVFYSRLSQLGGLEATEGAQVVKVNGRLSNPSHPLEKHGPQVTDQYVYDRVKTELIDSNRLGLRTAFNDRTQMENSIAETIMQNRAAIDTWVATAPRAGVPKPFNANPGLGNLGRGFEVTTPGGPITPINRPMINVNLVLISDGRGGYLIHTAHPF